MRKVSCGHKAYERVVRVDGVVFALCIVVDAEGDLSSIVGLTAEGLPWSLRASIDRACVYVGALVVKAQLMGGHARGVSDELPDDDGFSIERAVLKEILGAQLLFDMGVTGQDVTGRVSFNGSARL